MIWILAGILILGILHILQLSGVLMKLGRIALQQQVILEKEIELMGFTADQLAAIAAAVAQSKQTVLDALTKEKGEVIAQIQTLKDALGSKGVTKEELDALVAQIAGIGTSAATAIDQISLEDGADAPAGGAGGDPIPQP